MKKNRFLWQFAGFCLSTLAGTLLHFLYDWTGGSLWVAPFSGVSESTWEHMKLLFFPLFIWALIQSRFFKEQKNFWCIKAIGIIFGLVLIPVLFYTYNGAFGRSPDWLNIAIYFVAAAAAFALEWWLLAKTELPCPHPWIAFWAICFIGILFVVWTFSPPNLPLFQDPLTGTYGLS